MDLGEVIFSPLDGNSRVYKEQCSFCHATPEHDGGLFISLKNVNNHIYLSYCEDHLNRIYLPALGNQAEKVGFLNFTRKRKEKETGDEKNGSGTDVNSSTDNGSSAKISKLAIGIEGGIQTGGKEVAFDEKYQLLLVKPKRTEIPQESCKPELKALATRLTEMEGAMRQSQLDQGLGMWDGAARVNTKHLNIHQDPNPRRVPTSGWKCEWEEGCEKTDNLWLNLSSGKILCGRKFFDGTGGENHAVYHFHKTGYPLSVKLGTITPEGADVFSYDEDEMVLDPNLAVHLSHFGINMMRMEKTEKTMLEMELDLNNTYEYMAIQEEGSVLESRGGPGFTGMVNLGSSCYLNSTMQLLAITPEIENFFVKRSDDNFKKVLTSDPFEELQTQFTKVFTDLASGRFSGKDNDGIRPEAFRRLIGLGHPEFSSKRQQDAEEFMSYVLEKLEPLTVGGDVNPVDQFRFKLESKLKDKGSGLYNLTEKEELVLKLPIPKELLSTPDTTAKEDQKPKPKVDLQRLFEAFGSEENIPDYRSPVTGEITGASTTQRFQTFPQYLLIALRKFTVKEDWTPAKMDVEVVVPDTIDLEFLRGKGLQPGEDLLPQDEKMATDSGPTAGGGQMSENVTMLISLGFDRGQAERALEVAGGDPNYAASLLLEGAVPPTSETPSGGANEPQSGNADSGSKKYNDGNGRYKLIGFVSHMGSSCHSGHYVAHLLKDGQWTIFNDEKVAKSQNPPKNLGYLYLFQRT